MKRKIWSYALGVTMVLSLASCGNSAKNKQMKNECRQYECNK